MIADGDLIVCFLGVPPGAEPRVGLWSGDEHIMPEPLDKLTPSERRFLGAISFPEALTQTGLPVEDEREILAALTGPFTVSTARLDDLDIKAPLRSRARAHLVEVLAPRPVDEYLGAQERRGHSAPRVTSDVVELLRAARDGRWHDAKRVLAVSTAPAWPSSTPERLPSADAISLDPALLSSPAARRMLKRAVDGALQDPPPGDFILVDDTDPDDQSRPSEHDGSGTTGHDRRGVPAWVLAGATLLAIVAAVVVVVLLVTKGSDATGTSVPKPPTRTIYTETAGGPADVHEDYKSLAGVDSQAIGAGQPVQIACRLRGVKVGNLHNPWWYLIASPRFRGRYVTADAFYNNGQTSGDLKNTPLVDKKVQLCSGTEN